MAFLKKSKKEKETTSTPHEGGGKSMVSKEAKSGILLYPHFTEKTSAQAAQQKYVFAVAPVANQAEVKKVVEKRFGVKVEDVHMINIHGKERRRGKQIGWKPGIKKAIVGLAEGQTIEVQ